MPARHAAVDAYGGYTIQNVHTATTAPQAVGALVDTSSSTAIAGGGASTSVTPSGGTAMYGLRAGMRLAITDGTGTAEVVTVASVGATSFTAAFANAHSGTYNIRSLLGTFLGPVVFNQLGSAMTLTLYDGHPSLSGKLLATITPASAPFPFAALCQQGLFFTYTGTTAGDLSIHYQSADV